MKKDIKSMMATIESIDKATDALAATAKRIIKIEKEINEIWTIVNRMLDVMSNTQDSISLIIKKIKLLEKNNESN